MSNRMPGPSVPIPASEDARPERTSEKTAPRHRNLSGILSVGVVVIAVTAISAVIVYRRIPLPPQPLRPANIISRFESEWRKRPGDVGAARQLAGALDGLGR